MLCRTPPDNVLLAGKMTKEEMSRKGEVQTMVRHVDFAGCICIVLSFCSLLPFIALSRR